MSQNGHMYKGRCIITVFLCVLLAILQALMLEYGLPCGVWPPIWSTASQIEGGEWPPIVLVVARRGMNLRACLFLEGDPALQYCGIYHYMYILEGYLALHQLALRPSDLCACIFLEGNPALLSKWHIPLYVYSWGRSGPAYCMYEYVCRVAEYAILGLTCIFLGMLVCLCLGMFVFCVCVQAFHFCTLCMCTGMFVFCVCLYYVYVINACMFVRV